ncbi:hypothetical protein AB0903_13020 [Streptomyces sp. NPDC048389]|uniref:hypothetical protein n=1 Tax=Streptomyces sp. NPDC048389 TaxID=3154622 RepID=UPI003455A428
MDPIGLAGVVLPITAVLYGLFGLRRRRHRAAAERYAALDVDPYHAAASRPWPEDDAQAAAARLLLDGLITVNHRGNLSLTAAGADPTRTAGHPLPDALLTAVRRRTAPALWGRIALFDTAFGAAREDFHADCRTRLPSPSWAPSDGLVVAGVLLLMGEMLFSWAALVDARPRGPAQWATAAATGLALLAQIAWLSRYGRSRDTARRDPLADRLARTDLHPALAELAARDPESAARLRAGRRRTRHQRNRGRRGRPYHRTAPTGPEACERQTAATIPDHGPQQPNPHPAPVTPGTET